MDGSRIYLVRSRDFRSRNPTENLKFYRLKPNHPSNTNDYVIEAHHPWSISESCPEDSIPIERVQPDANFGNNGSRSINRYKAPPPYIHGKGQTNGHTVNADSFVHEHAIFRGRGTFFGAKAEFNVWNPKLEIGDGLTLAQIWVASKDGQISLEAGWMVSPTVNGDNETRFFLFWTTNQYGTSCFNLQCPGFVQTTERSIINPKLEPTSVFDGEQYAIGVEIFKDRANGNWWLRVQGIDMGYWPEELVSLLAGGAYHVDFGGEVAYQRSQVHTSSQMGSGHFPGEGFMKSCFVRNFQMLDTNYAYQDPAGEETRAENNGCYDIQVGAKKDGPWFWFFYFGGPGRSEKCI